MMAQSIENFGANASSSMTALTGQRVKDQGPRFARITAHSARNELVDRQAKPSGVVCSVLDDLVCVCIGHSKRPEPERFMIIGIDPDRNERRPQAFVLQLQCLFILGFLEVSGPPATSAAAGLRVVANCNQVTFALTIDSAHPHVWLLNGFDTIVSDFVESPADRVALG
jgi:hypothetical protein